nr:3'-5' exonuclease [Angustibacter aerolatus]
MALFDAAARFVDRLPQAGPREFVEYLRDQEAPGDTLAERGASGGAVSLLTPASAAGREWPVVVVAGVQDGVWPDLRPRGSLLGAEHLVDLLAGRERSSRAVRQAVREDETRLFHVAVSRASRTLVVTAVRDDDEQPSSLLDLVDPPPEHLPAPGWDDDGVRVLTPPPLPLTLAGSVARLRQLVADPRTRRADARAAARQAGPAGRGGRAGRRPGRLVRPRAAERRPVARHRRAGAGVAEQGRGVRPLRAALAAAGRGRHPGQLVAAESGRAGARPRRRPAAGPARRACATSLHRRWGALGLGEGWAGDVGRARAETAVQKARDLPAAGREPRAWSAPRSRSTSSLDLPGGPVRLTGRVDRLERTPRACGSSTSRPAAAPGRVPSLPERRRLGTYQARGAGGRVRRAGAGCAVRGGVAGAGWACGRRSSLASRRSRACPTTVAGRPSLVDTVARGMSASTFPATPNDSCDRCPVRTSCPARSEGRRVTE